MKPFPNHKLLCILFSLHPFEDCFEALCGMKTLNLDSVFPNSFKVYLRQHFQGLWVKSNRRPGFCFQLYNV